MQAYATQRPSHEGHLWMIAGALSLLINLCLLAMAGLASLNFDVMRKDTVAAAPAREETMVTIHAIPEEDTPAATSNARQAFARTSPDQAAKPEEKPAFIGERDTRATSDRAPVADAPPLPSQAGIEPRDESDFETTQSDYQDGELIPETADAPASEAAPAPSPPPAPVSQSAEQAVAQNPPPREVLLEGPNPVDVQVPRETGTGDEIKRTPETQTNESTQTKPTPEIAEQTKPAKPDKPAFRGNQRKAAIVGSISRTGRSSLDVEDSPLGRYQASISRAVELEWQRNCVRHRDFITPGFLTVRFFVEPTGKVRSVEFVGDMETGQVQKGFTLNSIRDASIPPMPTGLRGDYAKDPLELIFRFYF